MPDSDRRERRVVLEGALNFRDLGGYPTSDGRHVRWGAVYRSDHLSGLTDADHRVLAGLDLELVCDLRSADERAEMPNRLHPETPPRVASIPIAVQAGNELQELLASGERNCDRLRSVIVGGYREFVHVHRSGWSELFRVLLEERSGAAVVHCSAGRDRTGFAAALMLLAIGVPREVVLDDYLLTEKYLPQDSAVEDDSPVPASMLRDIWRPGPALLEASFATMESGYGSIEGYLSAIGVGDRARDALRDRWLV